MKQKLNRLFLSALMAVACAAAAPAQDAEQVLRISVGYNTLKNTRQMTAELRAEVERLGKLAAEATAAKNYGEALKRYFQAMALMRDEKWTPARALSSALTLKLDRTILEPGQAFKLKLGQLFALDQKPEGKLSGSIALAKPSGQDTVKQLKQLNQIEPDFLARPLTIDITAPDVEDGSYRLTLALKANSGETITKSATIRIERGLAARVSTLKGRIARLKAKLGRAPELIAELPSVEYSAALYDLANSSEINFERINFNQELSEAEALIAEFEAGKNPFATRRGDFRKAYRSKLDGTLQPYRIYVPSSYDGSKPYPLIIALHGMGGDENSYFDLYQNGAFKVEAERRGYIVACPKGRRPASMYVGDAEQDVIDVIAEVRRAYKIDPDRIYMTGHSMGGFGTWSIAMNHPDLFAAIAPIAGGGNPAGMSKIAHIPQLVVHGEDDRTVPVERSRLMVEAARKLGAEVKYLEIPKGDHISVAARTFKDVFDWFDSHKRARAQSAGSKN